MTETCRTCRFGEYRDLKAVGAEPIVKCRRYPNFIIKDHEDWCGEHQPRPAEQGEGE